jgi:hypothetical protein
LRCLAFAAGRVGDPADAERHGREALRLYEELGVPDETSAQAVDVATLLVDLGRSQEAADVLRRVRDSRRHVGPDDPLEPFDRILRDNLPALLERDRLVEDTRAELRRFDGYLRSLGFRWEGEPPSIQLAGDERLLGVFDRQRKVILLGTHAIGDRDIAVKEYVYHALLPALLEQSSELVRAMEHVPVAGAGFALGALMSGIATYYTCSYGNDPGFARAVGRLCGMPSLLALDVPRQMKDVLPKPTADPAARAEAIEKAGQVWASALWGIRCELGQAAADRLVAGAWQAALAAGNVDQLVADFAGALLEQSSTGPAGESIRSHIEACVPITPAGQRFVEGGSPCG